VLGSKRGNEKVEKTLKAQLFGRPTSCLDQENNIVQHHSFSLVGYAKATKYLHEQASRSMKLDMGDSDVLPTTEQKLEAHIAKHKEATAAEQKAKDPPSPPPETGK
jgi:hypothetical protein